MRKGKPEHKVPALYLINAVCLESKRHFKDKVRLPLCCRRSQPDVSARTGRMHTWDGLWKKRSRPSSRSASASQKTRYEMRCGPVSLCVYAVNLLVIRRKRSRRC
eukprot:COSAG01_NODE_1357_length_10597_cov_2.476948_7_plen_105_part_00